jgi:hypothetical protein
MKKILLILFIIPVLLSNSKRAKAQDIVPPSDFEVYMTVAPGDTSKVFGDTLFYSTTHLVGSMVIVLQDTLNIKSITVSMGSSSGGSDLFQKTFTFDNSGAFSDGTSYKRTGMNVYLGIGNYTGLNNFYSQAALNDNSGYSTPVVTYSPNN